MKVIENIKNIGHAIANGYRRLGEVDCPDEEFVLEGDAPEIKELLQAQAKADERYNNLNNSSSNAPKGGKGIKSQGIVQTVAIDPKAMQALAKKAQENSKQPVSKEQSDKEDIQL